MSKDKKSLLKSIKFKTVKVKLDDDTFIILSEVSAKDYTMLWEASTIVTADIDDNGDTINNIDMGTFSPLLLIYSIVDETGKRIFDESDIEEIKVLPQVPYFKMLQAAKKLNGLIGDKVNDSESMKGDSSIGELQ